MQITIDRKPRMYTTWFGLGSQKQAGIAIEVSIFLTEVEKEIIKRGALGDQMIYEHPNDKEQYDGWEKARQKRLREGQGAGGYLGGLKTFPRYQRSRLASHFLETPTHTIEPYQQDEFHLMSVEKELVRNIRQLKYVIEAVAQHPTGKKTFEL